MASTTLFVENKLIERQVLFSKKELLEYIGNAFSQSTLQRFLREHHIKFIRIGGKVFFRKEDVDTFLAKGVSS